MAKANSQTVEVAPASESAGLRAELERFKTRLELALDAGHMGAWQFDVDTGHVTWTATLEQIHGLEPGTFGGTFADYQRDIHPDDRARVLETITRSLAGTTPHQLLYRIVRPDGEVRWLEASGRLVRAADGRPLHMLGVCCDVTERVLSESQRRDLLLRAEAAVRTRDDLLAMVSHDLRTPLGVVAFSAEVIGERVGLVEPELLKDVERIRRAVTGMSRLISNLLDAASIETGTFDISLGTANVQALLDESFDAFARFASKRQVGVVMKCSDDRATIVCDRLRVRQVVDNLLGNAIKFAPEGTLVELSAQVDDARCTLTVRDRGPGIPAENTKLVFERYWHGKQSGHGGTGLGLYIAQGIVLAHQGSIRVESVVGEGSTFIVELPRSVSVR